MPIVADFAKELRRRSTPCATWHKVDLHNHSPASDDFQGDRATALRDYAEAIRNQHLSVVMFTDHERLPDADFIRDLSRQTGALRTLFGKFRGRVRPGTDVRGIRKPPHRGRSATC